MPEIKLNYSEVIALSNKMKTAADSFETNQKALEQSVKNLKASWSGSASDVMQKELQDTNKYVLEFQASLLGMAEFVAKAAEAIKATDETTVP